MLYLPRRIYEPLKGIVVVSGWEKKARITNNFACIKRTRNQMQSVDRMIHGAPSGKVLTWGGPHPPPSEGLKVSWNGVLLQMIHSVCFGHLWGHFTHMTRRFSFHATETVQATRRRKQLHVGAPPPMKEGTKIFNLHVACCRAATASAVIASLNYSFFTTILWIHIKF